MSLRKYIGYAVSLVGIVGLALTFDSAKTALKITLPASLTPTILTIASVVVIGVGLLLVFFSGKGHSKATAEVPIYQGKNLVGYRRH